MAEKITVLLVDDDSDMIEANKLALEQAGFAVITAESGKDGFSLATLNPIDVAVIDVMMETPTSGFTLARQLRQDPRTKQVRLIMLTSVNTANEAIGSFVRFSDAARDPQWLPVDRFVDKPIKPKDLVSLVRSLAGAWTFSHHG
jgi:two-component system, OmpR family, alkaline phosphatase synthesis response regulator PhoP